METVLKAIGDWLKSLLTAGIMSNLSGLFDAVNEQVGDIAQQIGTRPSAFEPRVFAMIESLSRNVVLPIAGIILTFIACYELIEMITQHNNMAQFEPALIMRWVFKTAISVWFISNTFDIVMAVFDLTQKVVADSSGIIAGNTRVNDIGLSMLEASLMQMEVGPLFGLFLQSFFIGITMRILSIVIFVIVYTITSYREARHWSNYDLASHAGIKPTTISTWYSKNIMPTLPTLVKVCDAFGITLTEFFSVVESGEREPVVLTHEQAEMLEKWSALRPEQKEAVVHLLSTMP